jgi:hypothetical protein
VNLTELKERARLPPNDDAHDSRFDQSFAPDSDPGTGTLPSPGSGVSPESLEHNANTSSDVESQGQSGGGHDADFVLTLVRVVGRDEHVPNREEEEEERTLRPRH